MFWVHRNWTCYIENTRWVSYDIKLTFWQGFEKACWHREACRAIQRVLKAEPGKLDIKKHKPSILQGSVKNNWELVNIFLLGRQFWLKLYTHIEWTIGLITNIRWRLIIFNTLLLGNRRPSLSNVQSRWRHFWLSSHEFKIISNLKQYNNGPFISPLVSNNVLAMFWRSEIDSKYNTCNVRYLATKIDENSNFN